MANPLRIPYQTESFPAGTIANGATELDVTWNDILWAAVTVGRPNRHYVFRHGTASRYEAVFRWSLVRMALEQRGSWAYRLHRTDAAKTLDPTEKGAVNYFLGMTFCKLFAAKLLKTPWLLHLDVFRPMLNPVLRGRSRPDLVGQETGTGQWHAFECKGRISPPASPVKRKAKAQAERVLSVDGTKCTMHIGAITHFRNDVLRFYWRDPAPEEGNYMEIPFTADAWRYYYAPVVEMLIGDNRRIELLRDTDRLLGIEDVDLAVGVHPVVARPLFEEQWGDVFEKAKQANADIVAAGYNPDGIVVKAGPTWSAPFRDPGLEER
jgi:hypothetical protein